MLKQAYSVTFTPLPVSAGDTVYFDKNPVKLPCTDDFQTLHYHDRYEIGICQDGEGVFLFEDKLSCVSNNDVIFILPGCRHYSRSLSKDKPCFCRFVYVDPKALEDLISHVCKENAPHILKSTQNFASTIISPADASKEAALLKELVEGCKIGKQDQSASTILRLALFILQAHSRFTRTIDSNDIKLKNDSAISAVAEYISINFDRNNTIDDLMKICNLSESQLRRRFTRVYGIPPIAYKNKLRCSVAANLLAKTQMSISEISLQVGYSDVSDFYRAFKKNYGLAPSTYRIAEQN